jgi:hypothetical protein
MKKYILISIILLMTLLVISPFKEIEAKRQEITLKISTTPTSGFIKAFKYESWFLKKAACLFFIIRT